MDTSHERTAHFSVLLAFTVRRLCIFMFFNNRSAFPALGVMQISVCAASLDSSSPQFGLRSTPISNLNTDDSDPYMHIYKGSSRMIHRISSHLPSMRIFRCQRSQKMDVLHSAEFYLTPVVFMVRPHRNLGADIHFCTSFRSKILCLKSRKRD